MAPKVVEEFPEKHIQEELVAKVAELQELKGVLSRTMLWLDEETKELRGVLGARARSLGGGGVASGMTEKFDLIFIGKVSIMR